MKTHRVKIVIFGYTLQSDLMSITQAEELNHVMQMRYNLTNTYVVEEQVVRG